MSSTIIAIKVQDPTKEGVGVQSDSGRNADVIPAYEAMLKQRADDDAMFKDTMLKRNDGSFCHRCNEVCTTDDICWVENHDEEFSTQDEPEPEFCRECFASLIAQGDIVVCQSCNENVWSDGADETNEFCEECAEETQ